ncbi:MAG TPA: Asp-tRNA(Asn)/Glu-tRNA(Gln) amidotransferase subunit GatB [Spirochaetota bacterium]|nr:Asp-tRNA(Asn)/Glu-tRNA(Gln) amidotransferase subunit GatB [Spirochaetota bacterium]HOH37029.1 Asp-tRNA(Asn)/Glu-tRNA(Gln) amidotransferase subunit GatB [Spirochaetota bacterium]HPY02690.1 Asp-tRNA(Asn)/Glu-tRNA(Gln) amidotransferase subunit GatB [Spirochaetota bacterium]HQA51307.1 Asp-tRNA(Asn)/Glu-tRNA(Gln) amidotransferase subunit GatB [Spirochaetota bacterium]
MSGDKMKYKTVIGLEVHAQLNTESKIFCSCSTEFGAAANTHACPVCMGLPGVLPVLNKKVLEKAILAGLATECSISEYSKFDRKNYFYPDLPKAYQISQFDKPICKSGKIRVKSGEGFKDIRLNRIHLEEDAAKNVHPEDASKNYSYVDFNRSGTPLIEIVTEPDISSGDEAYEFLSKLKQILRYIGVSDCNMEEGSLRCDVNISIMPEDATKLGNKVEIKNMNSFKAVKLAIEFEYKRQLQMTEYGETIVQETRLWNADKLETYSMRSKEDSHDYRYFPDPDLAPVIVDKEFIDKLKSSLAELPDAKIDRFMKDFALPIYDASVLSSTRELAEYFEKTVSNGANPKKASNWIMSELLAHVDDSEKMESFIVKPESLAKLLLLVDKNVINGKIAKTVFADMLQSGDDPEEIVNKKGLVQVSDTSEIEKIVEAVIAANPQSIADIKEGKAKAAGFLVGQVMKESKGKANPQIVNEILNKCIAKL